MAYPGPPPPMMPMAPMAPAPMVQHYAPQTIAPQTNVVVNVGKTGPRRQATCCAVYCALIFPPLGVSLYKGGAICDADVCITFLLWFLLFIPGTIYALMVICGKIKSR